PSAIQDPSKGSNNFITDLEKSPAIWFSNASGVSQVPITVADGVNAQVLAIGTDPQGTAGFDPGLDVLVPPPPPTGAFDARLSWLGEDYFTDIRS
ncbi:MAG: hypothetical protein GWN00_06885, partial [Aliifodinibius sp.]|nr:hypothetical protein [Fodinibius sp.]NIY24543.1 hypothetical protein [Fodinibius sp.]